MGITSAIVLFAVIWFMVFFVVLPLGLKTQSEVGEVVPGTHGSSPANLDIKHKAKVTSLWAIGLWVVIAGTILSGVISVRDLDYFQRMSTPQITATGGTDG